MSEAALNALTRTRKFAASSATSMMFFMVSDI
jgi:hypothetical protein